MPLHPQAKSLLTLAAESGAPKLNELTPQQAREQALTLRQLAGSGPEVASIEDFSLPTSDGAIAARRYEPADAAGTVLWLHGGGWVICDLDTHDAMCRLLAVSSGARVIAVDYRLAPEHPFPAPLEDCWDALKWVAGEYGDEPVIIGGDSAGGNMAAVCALRARDLGGPELALQVLVYPATDHDMTKASCVEHGSGPETFLTVDEMEWFTGHYLPDEADRTRPEVAPLLVPDLSGLAPAIVITAEYDPLRDDGLEYAERLREAGVSVSHHHYDDMIHAFFSLVNLLERGNEAVEQVGSEIRAVVARSGAPA
jgi:acetyl esterase